VVAPVSILAAVVQVSAMPGGVFTQSGTSAAPPTIHAGDLAAFGAGFAVVAVLNAIAGQFAAAASFKIVSSAYLGEEMGWRPSARFARENIRSLLWLETLLVFFLILGFSACVVPGIYFYGAWAVATPVLLLEGTRGRKALKRSRALVRGRWWPTSAALALAGILAGIISTMMSGLFLALSHAGGNDVVSIVAQGIGRTLSSVLTTPLSAAVITVIYFDLRVRKEGFDLELLARRVGVEPGPRDHSSLLPDPLDPRPTSGSQPPFWPPPPGWRPDE